MKGEYEKTIQKVSVFKGTKRIGTLSRTEKGALFAYTRRDESLCFAMPTAEEQYELHGNNLHPFFAGLLPEGLRLEALKRAIKTSKDDLFSLLMASGSDTIGDVSVAEGERLVEPKKHEGVELRTASFDDLLEENLAFGDRWDDLSVPGIQPKISGGLISFPISIAKKRSQYILKLSPKEYPRLVENEAFFMQAARQSGIQTANFELVKDCEGKSGLLVERFDRLYSTASDSKWLKLHQEDGCQILDRYPADKYLVSFREAAAGISRFSTAPIVEIARLLQLQAFSYLVGNGDLHAKNISLITDPSGSTTRLSPAYDIVSTYPYGDTAMALAMEGKKDNLKRRDFLAFGNRFGVREIPLSKILEEILSSIDKWISRIDEIGFDSPTTLKLKELIKKRAADLQFGN